MIVVLALSPTSSRSSPVCSLESRSVITPSCLLRRAGAALLLLCCVAFAPPVHAEHGSADPQEWCAERYAHIYYYSCLYKLVTRHPPSSKLALLLDTLLMPATALHTSLAQPDACIVCSLLLTLLDIVRPVGAVAFDLLLVPTLVLLGVGFMFSILIGAGKILLSPVQSSRPWSDLAVSGLRFVIAILLLGGAATLTPASLSGATPPSSNCNSFDVLYGRLVEPFLGTSISLGMVLLDRVTLGSFTSAVPGSSGASPFLSQARKHAELYRGSAPTPATSARCAVAPASGAAASPALDNLLVYASGLQLLGSLGMAQGIGFLRDAQVVSKGGARWIAFIAGVLVLLLFAVFIVVAGVRLLDPLLRVLLVLALSPLLIAAWVFAPTRSAARVGLRAFAYAFFFFVVAGAIYGVAFSLILASASTTNQLDQCRAEKLCGGAVRKLVYAPGVEVPREYCFCHPQAFETYEGLVQCVLHQGGSVVLPELSYPACVEPSDPSRTLIDLSKVLVTLISLLLAQSLIALVTSISGSLSDYSAGDNIAQGAESQMRGLATSAVHTSAYAGAAVMRGFASKARNLIS